MIHFFFLEEEEEGAFSSLASWQILGYSEHSEYQ